MRLRRVALVVCFLIVAASAAAERPYVLSWTHPAHPPPFDVLRYEYQAVGAEVWIPIPVYFERAGVFYGFAFLGASFPDLVWIRAVSQAGTTMIVSGPSNFVPTPCTPADMDRNGAVGISDFATFKAHFGKGRVFGTCED